MLSYDFIDWGKPLEQRERATPTPQGSEVLVKLKYCGVCHSDVHIRDGYFDLGGLRKGGKLILVGLFGGEINLSIASTILRALTVLGSHLGSVAELKAVVELARAGKIKPIPVDIRPLSAVSRTLDELKRVTIVGRVVAAIS